MRFFGTLLFIGGISLLLMWIVGTIMESDEQREARETGIEERRLSRKDRRQLKKEARASGLTLKEMKEIDRALYPQKYAPKPPERVPGGTYVTSFSFGSMLLLGTLIMSHPGEWEFYSGSLTALLLLFGSAWHSFGVQNGYWPYDRSDYWEVFWTALWYPFGFACIGGLIFLLTGGCN